MQRIHLALEWAANIIELTAAAIMIWAFLASV